MRVLKKPMILIKDAAQHDLLSRAEKVARVVKAASARERVDAVFAHQDCDCFEPGHVSVAARIETTLIAAGCPGLIYGVVPAWETEAWWFLWPDLVGQVRESWREPRDYDGRDVGKVQDAKEELARCVRPSGVSASKRFPEYQESDSIEIARRVREADRADGPFAARSGSYDRFRANVADLNAAA